MQRHVHCCSGFQVRLSQVSKALAHAKTDAEKLLGGVRFQCKLHSQVVFLAGIVCSLAKGYQSCSKSSSSCCRVNGDHDEA